MLSNSGIGVQKVAGGCLTSLTIQWVPRRPSSLRIQVVEIKGTEVTGASCIGQVETVDHFV